MGLLAALFDLDGVLVDTAKYHYRAWKRLAHELGFEFSERENEQLKGVSRMQSLDILLEKGQMSGRFSLEERTGMASRKNEWYVASILSMDDREILPGVKQCLAEFRAAGIKTALGSASVNAGLIMTNLGLLSLFDVIVDGRRTSRAKPDPEVFLLGAQDLGIDPSNCVVFEDSQAGLDAARAGGMHTVAIGNPQVLTGYDLIVSGLDQVNPLELIRRFA